MDIIEGFMARYVREYDYYEQASRIVADRLERDLQESGVRSIITHRAKSVVRLEAKCQQRNAKQPYSSVEQIYDDIVDLAGVRVALYFPGQRPLVGKRVQSLFKVVKEKSFPDESIQKDADKRFEGYSAVHYHVRLREEDLAEPDQRYATARVEIQVASVLMHGWAEVEHDLVYKPQGQLLSEEEYALLDSLNGLVMTGEGLLESLQRAGDRRIAEGSRKFANHYELAAHLLSQPNVVSATPISESGLGRVDLLFEFLKQLGLFTPADLDGYLEGLHDNLESRPLAEQVSDALMAEDASRYEIYRAINRRPSDIEDDARHFGAVGRFISSWVSFELLERELTPGRVRGGQFVPPGRALEEAGLLTREERRDIEILRRVRNQLVHGIEVPPAVDLLAAAEHIDAITEEIRHRASRGEEEES